MKKISIAFVLMLAGSIMLSGCAQDQEPSGQPSSAVSSEPLESVSETENTASRPETEQIGSEQENTASEPEEPKGLTDEDILELVTPYLENMDYQDPSLYPSMNEFYLANLGLDEKDIASAVLYMGAPQQNTGFFLMLTKTEHADSDRILEKLQ